MIKKDKNPKTINFDIALLKIIKNVYIKNQKEYSDRFITDRFLDFLEDLIDSLERIE